MQTIVLHLIFQDLQPHPIREFSPWIDRRLEPLDELINQLEAQRHRRCIKSHLPLDGLPYFPQVKYIIVARDIRDIFMSMWNHYANFTPEFYELANNYPGLVGEPLDPAPDDIRVFWEGWINRGKFAWESQGYPFQSPLHHFQTWWDYRHLSNILLIHYNDLLADLPGEIRRIADYLNIAVSPEMLASIADAVSFSNMKTNAEQVVGIMGKSFIGGAQTFINKGTNGRWRAILTESDLDDYAAAVAREATPDCAQWLENGRSGG
jgi:aryl sulfotransferase